jgi:hypothetical protein
MSEQPKNYSSIPTISPPKADELPTMQEINQQQQVRTNTIQTQPANVFVYESQPKVIVIEKAPSRHISHGHVYPSVSKGLAVLILILNIFLPGVGTIVLGCHSNEPAYFILIGLAQMLLAWVIFGWIWSIMTAIQVLTLAH